MEVIHHYINGAVVEGVSDERLPVYNPALGQIIAEVSLANTQEIEQVVSAAKAAFPLWRDTPVLKRSRVLFRFKALLEQQGEALARKLSEEHGKLVEDAKGEVMRGIELIEFLIGAPALLKGSYSEEVASGIDCYTMRQPLGVCMGVSPFNFPIMISIWQASAAIVAGNTFIAKPSEKDPSTPIMLAKLWSEAGLPKGVYNVINGDRRAVDALLHHPDVKTAACVGSTAVAEYIYKTAIAQGKRAHSFGGAKNHAILMPDADMDLAVESIYGAAFGAAGERCMALPVVLAIGDTVADELVARLKDKLPHLKIGPGDQVGVEMGPLVTREHWGRVKSYVDLGIQEGATLCADGRALMVPGYEQGFFMGPCLFDHVTPEMRIYREEIFGPVLCVVRVDRFDHAIELINQHEYGNGTAIFTRDGDSAREFAHKVEVGMVGINVPIPVPIAYHSFGGWKRSVFGDIAMHGGESLRFYTKPKSVTQRWTSGIRGESCLVMPTH